MHKGENTSNWVPSLAPGRVGCFLKGGEGQGASAHLAGGAAWWSAHPLGGAARGDQAKDPAFAPSTSDVAVGL